MKLISNNTNPRSTVAWYGDCAKNPTSLYTGWEGNLDRAAYEQCDNYIFQMDFKYSKMVRGRSAVNLNIVDADTGVVYIVALDGLKKIWELLESGAIYVEDGLFKGGFFTIAKKGANYQCTPLSAEELDPQDLAKWRFKCSQ